MHPKILSLYKRPFTSTLPSIICLLSHYWMPAPNGQSSRRLRFQVTPKLSSCTNSLVYGKKMIPRTLLMRVLFLASVALCIAVEKSPLNRAASVAARIHMLVTWLKSEASETRQIGSFNALNNNSELWPVGFHPSKNKDSYTRRQEKVCASSFDSVESVDT